MNWRIVCKSLSIIFASALIISGIFTGLWIFLNQQKETTSAVSTLNSDITDFAEVKKNDFNNIFSGKEDDYNNINFKKFNRKNNTYEETNRTLITSDKQTKVENNNYNIKIENTNLTVKPVSVKNSESNEINSKIQDEIVDPKIKEMIPKIENRDFLNNITNNSVADENTEIIRSHVGDRSTEETRLYNDNNSRTTTATNVLDPDELDVLLTESTIVETTGYADNDNVDTGINSSVIGSLKHKFPFDLNISEEFGAQNLNIHSELNIGAITTTEKVGYDSGTTHNIRLLDDDSKRVATNMSSSEIGKDVMIVTPTTIDSENMNININTEITASGNLDKTLYSNNGSDRVIIVTPTIIGEDNILNKDQSTDLDIIQPLDSNLKNSTNSDGNELNNPEISTSTMNYSSFFSDDDIDDNTNNKIQGEDNKKCYGELGCLSITPTWYNRLNRNLNLLPQPREAINTSIIIYTRDNPTKGQFIVVSKIKSVELINFNPKHQTKFIIHGFGSSSDVLWAKEMKNELLQHDDFNVIVVNWARGSAMHLLYTQATGNTRLVGLEIAYLIKHLQVKYGLKLNDVHLIGHSLGAHTAGYAGEKLKGKIGRISGLDPAMPNFEKMPTHVRLDSTDAKFVDVIHTDSERIVRLGIYQPCGHLDFYPNNGDDQPGCSESYFTEACDHIRAIKLFTESINSKCQFIAYECRTYEQFTAGECFSYNITDSHAIMGYHADKSPALLRKLTVDESGNVSSKFEPKFFISTGDKYPYCRRHYRITIKLASPYIAKTLMQGFLNVTFYGDNGVIHNIELTPNGQRMKLSHGGTKQIIALASENAEYSIEKIRKAELSWIYDSKLTDLFYICLACNDVLYVDNIVVDILDILPERKKREMDFSIKLCSIQGPKKYTAIMSNSSATFVDNC